MANSEVEIANLVYRYAELIDSGDLKGAATLFAHARIKTGIGDVDAEGVLQMWQNSVYIYPDGTPRTKHVITNPIIEVNEETGCGSCRSYYTVLQQADDGPLQAVICGRYHDAFERIDGRWRFRARDYSLHDLVGDMSRHSRTFGKHTQTRDSGQQVR